MAEFLPGMQEAAQEIQQAQAAQALAQQQGQPSPFQAQERLDQHLATFDSPLAAQGQGQAAPQETAQPAQAQQPAQVQQQQAPQENPLFGGVYGLPAGATGGVLPTAGGNWAKAANDPTFLAQQAARAEAQAAKENGDTASLIEDLSKSGFFDDGSQKFVYYSDIEMPNNNNFGFTTLGQNMMKPYGLTYKPNGDYTNEEKQKWYQSDGYKNSTYWR